MAKIKSAESFKFTSSVRTDIFNSLYAMPEEFIERQSYLFYATRCINMFISSIGFWGAQSSLRQRTEYPSTMLF